MGKAEDKVVKILERRGGEIRAAEGTYRLPSVNELFGVNNKTVAVMVEKGIIEREGTATTTTLYKLVGYKPVRLTEGKTVVSRPRQTQIVDSEQRNLLQREKINAAAEILFRDRHIAAYDLLDWLELTKELMNGA